MNKLIIEVRINEYAMRDGNRNVPWTAEDIGTTAREIALAGASIVHFHARQDDGKPAHGVEAYAAAIRAIRDNSDLLVHPTLGQITVAGQEERIRHILELAQDPKLRPDLVGIDTGSTNIDVYDARAKIFRSADKVYVNSHETLMLFCRRLRACGVKPSLAAWSGPFLRSAEALLDMGLAEEPAYVLLVHCEGRHSGWAPGNSGRPQCLSRPPAKGAPHRMDGVLQGGQSLSCRHDGHCARRSCRDRHRRLCVSGAWRTEQRRACA